MTNFLIVEPAPELAGRFAVWCLGRDQNVQTVSAGGFLIPLDWYADIPSELLAGSFVDGFPVDGVSLSTPAGERPVGKSELESTGRLSDVPDVPKRRSSRKRSSNGVYSRKASGESDEDASSSDTGGSE